MVATDPITPMGIRLGAMQHFKPALIAATNDVQPAKSIFEMPSKRNALN